MPTMDPPVIGEATYQPPAAVPYPVQVAPLTQARGDAAYAASVRPRSSILESAGAAASQWSTKRLWDNMTGPSFEPEQYDQNAAFQAVPIPLSGEEHDFISAATSQAEFTYRLDQVKSRRDALQSMGDNPITSFIAGAGDPIWFGVSLASGGLGMLANTARAGRLVAAAGEVGGAIGLGVSDREQAPVGWQDTVLNAMIGGAGAMWLGGRGRIDSGVADELQNVVKQAQTGPQPGVSTRWVPALNPDGTPRLSASGKPVLRQVQEVAPHLDDTPARAAQVEAVQRQLASDTPTTAPKAFEPVVMGKGTYTPTSAADALRASVKAGVVGVAEFSAYLLERAGALLDDIPVITGVKPEHMPTNVPANAVGVFDPTTNRVLVTAGASPHVINHEIAHALTSRAINLGLARPGTALGDLAKELDNLRKRLVKMNNDGSLPLDQHGKYYLSNAHELVAGLYSSNKPFMQALNGVKARPGSLARTALQELFNVVRRALGMPVSQASALAKAMRITDDLITQGSKGLPPTKAATTGVDMMPAALEVAGRWDKAAAKVGNALGWSLHKSIAKFNRSVADRLVADPLNPANSAHSVDGMSRAIRQDLRRSQVEFEDLYRKELAARGAGTFKRTVTPTAATKVQQALDKEVAGELWARQQAAATGAPRVSQFSPAVQHIADVYDNMMKSALSELQRSGVAGAEGITHAAGWFSRRWDPARLDSAMRSLVDSGAAVDMAAAKNSIRDLIGDGIAKANPAWDAQTVSDVATALVDRAIRKGNGEDAGFRGHIGNEAIVEIRDVLNAAGIPADRAQRVIDVVAGTIDEAGKPSFLKHRISLDLDSSIPTPTGSVRLTDLMDTDMLKLTERYLDGVASTSAFQRAGLGSPSEIAGLRKELLEKVPHQQRTLMADMFDNTIAHIQGRPAGDIVPNMMRQMQAMTQMLGLGSSGIWQLTEYATIMQRYGLAKSLAYAVSSMPGFSAMKNALGTDRRLATEMSNMLTYNSAQDVRLQPFVNRLEDNFSIDPSNVVLNGLQNAKQWVPYLNGMKYIHHHQARMTANIITDEFVKAVRGDVKARELFKRYGLEAHIIDDLAPALRDFGTDVAKWPDKAWDALRSPLSTMMDEAVIYSRRGEIPAFAQFSQLGKFLFTFRSFVLGAHNKLLGGTLAQHGFLGLSMMMLYQFPLSVLAVQANAVSRGKEPLKNDKEMVSTALGQMGSIGLLSELAGLASGNKSQFGSPGMIPLDRIYRIGSSFASNTEGATTKAVLNAVPLLPVFPIIRAWGASM